MITYSVVAVAIGLFLAIFGIFIANYRDLLFPLAIIAFLFAITTALWRVGDLLDSRINKRQR